MLNPVCGFKKPFVHWIVNYKLECEVWLMKSFLWFSGSSRSHEMSLMAGFTDWGHGDESDTGFYDIGFNWFCDQTSVACVYTGLIVMALPHAYMQMAPNKWIGINLWINAQRCDLCRLVVFRWVWFCLCCIVTIKVQVLRWDSRPRRVFYHFSLPVKDKALGHVILSGSASVSLPLNIQG